MKLPSYDNMRKTLAKLRAYTIIDQPDQADVVWSIWWAVELAYMSFKHQVGSLPFPYSGFNRALTSIVELADIFLEDDDDNAKHEEGEQ